MTSFFTNYRGAPFMQGLFENKALLIMLGGTQLVTFAAASGQSPDLNEVRAGAPPRFCLPLPYRLYDLSWSVVSTNAQLMEIVMEWPSEEFSQLLMGVLAADFLGSLVLDALVGLLFPLQKGFTQ